MWLFILPIASIITFGVFIEARRKKRNDLLVRSSSVHTRPGESSNYKMGDNHYTSGGE